MSRWCMMLLLTVFSALQLYAQKEEITVTGTVKDTKGETLVGVNIVIENQPGLGVVSDIDGNYKIKADKYATLVASFIGYKTQRIAIAGKEKHDIVLEEEVEQLDEVSVVAAGVQRKATVVGAITTVDVEKLKTSGGSQLSNTLAGNVAGIIAMQRSGEPGANYSEFWIRGISTFGANSSALVLVDGIERDFNELNAEDIESFSVLKDASATAIYGQRGANGVVLVTTKRGKEGKVKINVKGEFGISTPSRMPEYVDGLTLAAYFLGFTRLAAPGLEGAVANTMAFATLTLCQLFHAFNVRSEDRSLLEQGLLSNPAMNKAFLAGASMQLAVLLFPPLQSVFSVVPMDGGQWLTVLLLAAAPIPICELAKALGRRREMAETRGVPPDHGTGRPVSGAGAAK